ncbi:hypothetical protein Tco_0287578 [Tanacetum coccineum]
MTVQTRRQLATDPEMCMFTLTDELHHTKKDEDQDCIFATKRVLYAKGYAQEKVLILTESFAQLLAWKAVRIISLPAAHNCSARGFVDPDPSRRKRIPSSGYKLCMDLSKLQRPGGTMNIQPVLMSMALLIGIHFLGDMLLSLDAQRTKLHFNCLQQRHEYRGVFLPSCAQVIVDEEQLQDYASTTTIIRCVATLQSSHSNLSCKPRTTFAEQSNILLGIIS